MQLQLISFLLTVLGFVVVTILRAVVLASSLPTTTLDIITLISCSWSGHGSGGGKEKLGDLTSIFTEMSQDTFLK